MRIIENETRKTRIDPIHDSKVYRLQKKKKEKSANTCRERRKIHFWTQRTRRLRTLVIKYSMNVNIKKKNLRITDRLPFENFPSRMNLYQKLGNKSLETQISDEWRNRKKKREKRKEMNERNSARIGKEDWGVNPGSSFYDRGYSWRYRLPGTPMQLHNEVVTAIVWR